MDKSCVGSMVWVVRRYGKGGYRTITKIGRRWVYLDSGDRFEADDFDMRIDGRGYSSPGRCYASKAEYERSLLINKAWSDTYSRLTYSRPGCLNDIDSINRVRELVGLEPFIEEGDE